MQIGTPRHRWQLTFEGHWPTAVTFLGSGQRLAAGNRGGQILVWDLPSPNQPAAPSTEKPDTGQQPQDVSKSAPSASKTDENSEDAGPPNLPPGLCLEGHANGITHLLATSDGRTLISSSLDRTVRYWDLEAATTGSANLVLDSDSRRRRARTRPEGERPEILDAPGVDVPTLAATHVLEGHRDWVGSLALSRDGNRLISGDAASQVVCRDRLSREEIARWSGHSWNGIVALALSPDGQTALVSEYTYKRDDFDIPAAALKLWNTSDGSPRLDLLKLQFPKLDAGASTYGAAQVWRKFVAGGLIAADFSPDGKLVAVGQGGETDNGQVHLFETEGGKLLRSVSGHRYGVCDVRFSDDGQYVLSSGRDTTIRICQVADGQQVATLGKERGGQFKDWIHSLAISPDQQLVAGADIAGHIQVWSL